MATALDIAKRNPNAASVAVSDAARASGPDLLAIEKKAELSVAPGTALCGTSLVGLTREQLKAKLGEIGVPEREQKMRAAQLWHWIYLRGAQDFAEMTNVGKGLRAALTEAYTLDRPQVVSEQVSKDGTRKWLIRMAPTGPHDKGAEIECVYIPETDRGTLCVSSQVGCTLTCSFCHTGTQRLVRNLTSAEIVAQLVVARDRIGDWPDQPPPDDGFLPREAPRFITNIVFMGMGEPLYNTHDVIDAIGVIVGQRGPRPVASPHHGLDLRRRAADRAPRRGGQHHAGDLAPRGARRIAQRAGADQPQIPDRSTLLDACRAYPGLSNARRITFEYVMLKGVNDSDADARELVRLLKGIPAKINLIPFNPWPGSKYECSDWERIERFSEIVYRAGYASPVRTPRGRDILAACGQLKSETEKLRARARLMLEQGIGAEGVYALGDSD